MLAFKQLPVLGISGCSRSDKVALMEKALAVSTAMALKTVVLKRNWSADHSIYSEADVCSCHGAHDLITLCRTLCREYDVVLVDGFEDVDLSRVWLLGEGRERVSEGPGDVAAIFSRRQLRQGEFSTWFVHWLTNTGLRIPVWGAVLIGGKSSRMGRPKHLLEIEGVTWLERIVHKLSQKVEQVVISGKGEIPAALHHLPVVPDVPGLGGPLAGILALMRWQPWCNWLLTATDQPSITSQSLEWLLSHRHPGVRAVLPDLEGKGRVEPFLAYYDMRCRSSIEHEAADGSKPRPGNLKGLSGVLTPQPPEELRDSWRNINTPEGLSLLNGPHSPIPEIL